MNGKDIGIIIVLAMLVGILTRLHLGSALEKRVITDKIAKGQLSISTNVCTTTNYTLINK